MHVVSSLLLLGASIFGEAGPRDLDPERCHALIVGVLEWKSPSFGSFAKEDRQDALLAQKLHEMGVPQDQVSVLLDKQATLANIEASLLEVSRNAGPGSTLVFYYAGHGTRSGKSACFANYDMTGPANGLSVDTIANIILEQFEGERVLLFADCCHSGSLSSVVEKLSAEGIEAASVASVVAESTSTGNWTFTQTLVEAFGGDPSLDANADGGIDLGELESAVSGAMAWRESQRSADIRCGVEKNLRLATVVPSAAASLHRETSSENAGKATLGDHVRDVGSEKVGKIVGASEDGRPIVRYYEYATFADRAQPWEELELVSSAPQVAVDALVGVRKGRDTIVARVVEIDPPFSRVSFPAWPEMGKEWMLAARFTAVPEDFDAARACMVEWKGDWYPALVIGTENQRWQIHYLGHNKSWDEWVEAGRIRFPTNAGSD